jgi:hypothetical protein
MGCQEWELGGIRGGRIDVRFGVENGKERMDTGAREGSDMHRR